MAKAFIGDGYTVKGAYVAGVDKFYPPVTFDFRPATSLERAQFGDALGNLSPAKADEHVSTLVAKKLVRWDITVEKDGAEVPLPITVKNVQLLHPELQGRLFTIVMGRTAWDDKPEAETTPESERQVDVAGDAKN